MIWESIGFTKDRCSQNNERCVPLLLVSLRKIAKSIYPKCTVTDTSCLTMIQNTAKAANNLCSFCKILYHCLTRSWTQTEIYPKFAKTQTEIYPKFAKTQFKYSDIRTYKHCVLQPPILKMINNLLPIVHEVTDDTMHIEIFIE